MYVVILKIMCCEICEILARLYNDAPLRQDLYVSVCIPVVIPVRIGLFYRQHKKLCSANDKGITFEILLLIKFTTQKVVINASKSTRSNNIIGR